MQDLAEALASLAAEQGAELRFGTRASRLCLTRGAVSGVELEAGESLRADAVVFNGDAAALTGGLLGRDVKKAVTSRQTGRRSLSAVTLSLAARATGFPLDHHTVFFGNDYADEFDSIFRRGEVTSEPTVYVCARDRDCERPAAEGGPERIFCLMNAPARPLEERELDRLHERLLGMRARHGLKLEAVAGEAVATGPGDFADLFPGTDGALYGQPTHGWAGSFRRPGARSRIAGLFLTGGSVHPGAGIPMAVLSGRLAAKATRGYLGL